MWDGKTVKDTCITEKVTHDASIIFLHTLLISKVELPKCHNKYKHVVWHINCYTIQYVLSSIKRECCLNKKIHLYISY